MHIGKKIKLLRNLRGYTQEGLAEKVNKTRALISHIEQTGKINFYTLQTILNVLNVSHQELEDFDENNLLQESSSAKEYNKSELAILKQKLESCIRENEMLRELVKSQKKIIQMMKKGEA